MMTRLGPFELNEVIGRGGMGEIWRARHLDGGVDVAVKIMRAPPGGDDTYQRLFGREVRAVASLHHPGIVRIHDYGAIPEAAAAACDELWAQSPYLVMELAEGGSLVDWPRPSSFTQLVDVLMQVLDSLAHAHAQQLFHRDLKPGNVLVFGRQRGRPQLKLTDFGLAHLASPDAFSRTQERDIGSAGTPGYMAPEQIQGHWRKIGPWTDLYALGCMVYQLACAELPFSETHPVRLAMAHLRQEPAALRPRFPVPERFEAWVHRLLAKAPHARFQTAADAAWALAQIAQSFEDPVRMSSGPAPSDDATQLATLTMLVAESTTEPLGDADTLEAADVAPTYGAASSPAVVEDAGVPPMPDSWAGPEPMPVTLLSGTGLGILKLKQVGFVGRKSERDTIWAELRRVRQEGRARALLLSGPTGCGKSFLAEWMASRADELGAAHVMRVGYKLAEGERDGLRRLLVRFLRAEGLDDDELEPFIDDQLRARFGADEHLPEASALAECVASGAAASHEARHSPKQAILSLMRCLTKRRPVLLCIDDAQWGAEALELVANLVGDGGESLPVLCLLTVRDESLAERPVEEQQLIALRDHPRVGELVVGPLGSLEHRRLIRQFLPLDDAVVDQLAERTAGNPLFARELLGDWVERGVLVPHTHGFRPHDERAAELPETVHEVWRERLERLLDQLPIGGDDVRQAIELAACAGRRIDRAHWVTACKIAGLDVPANLIDIFARARLIQGDGSRGTFSHEMLRESILRVADEAGRLQDYYEIHLATLDRLHPDAGIERVEQRCRYLLGAGRIDEAVGPLLQAARHERDHFQRGATHRLVATAEEALEQLQASDDDPRWVEMWSLLAWIHMYSHSQEAVRYLELVEANADPGRHIRELASVANVRAAIARDHGERDDAIAHQQRALDYYEQLGDTPGMVSCLNGLGMLRELGGEYDEALTTYRSALEMLEESGEQDALLFRECLLGIGRAQMKLERLDDAQRALDKALYYAKKGPEGFEMSVHNDLGGLARLRGDLARAEDHYRACRQYHRDLGSRYQHMASLNVVLVLIMRERHDQARELCVEAARGLQANGLDATLTYVNALLMCCAGYDGDWESWDRFFEKASAHSEASLVDRDIAWAVEEAAQLAHDAGELERAAKLWPMAAAHWEPLDAEYAAELRQRAASS
jgi:eukaryotic-like serine/threonine-protein kinase